MAHSSLEVIHLNFTNMLRRNIGAIIAGFGFVLLCIITFGDLGELLAEEYWQNVKENLMGISFMTIGLTFIHVSINQGVAEQALQRGLNAETTTKKYEEHKEMVTRNNDRQVYLPYFLRIYNKKHTQLRKQEYLVNNNYSSEKMLRLSGNAKLIKGYEKICVNLTVASIKWSTAEVIYDKHGRILTLDDHRKRRLVGVIVRSFAGMIGTAFITGGLFFSPSNEPLWQKFVRLFVYCIVIAMSAVFTVIKEYEKGAFGVPNELDEINQIWHEFEIWEIPEWVVREVDELNKEDKEVDTDGQKEEQRAIDDGTDIPEKQEEGESVFGAIPGDLVSIPNADADILLFSLEEQRG